MLDERVMKIVDDAVMGKAPSRSDVVFLLRFDAYSPEAAYVCARAREVGMRACNRKGYVYAQIGVDSSPCPRNCRFCPFAEANVADNAMADSMRELPIGRIVHFAKVMEDAGADVVSLMATAGLSFKRYLDMVRAVSASLSGQATLMVNAGDLSMDQARELKEAGVGAAYHAIRLGEGELTDIKPLDRRRTIRHLRAMGIPIMTAVEPLWEGADPVAISEIINDIPEFGPFCIDAFGLETADGSRIGGLKPALAGSVRYVAAITRLVCWESAPIGGIGGVAWVNVGCGLIDQGVPDDDAALRARVRAAKRSLARDGFKVSNLG